MTENDPNQNPSASLLRKRAEKKLRADKAAAKEAPSLTEMQRVLHELTVHQIELEMQNVELRRAQGELDVARERYFDLYNLAPVGYLTLSEKGLILEANLTAASLLGVARGALVKKPLTRFIVPEDQDIYYRHRKRLFETGAPQACELRLVKQAGSSPDGVDFQGSPLWAHLEATVAKDVDEAPICRVMLSDITERKRVESQRETALEEAARKAKELKEKNDELTRFTNAVSHDLRSPLVTVKTFLGHLEEDLRTHNQEQVERDLGFIRTAADKMGRLLDELLRLSRVGQMINPAVEAILQTIVKEALDVTAGRITARGVRIKVTNEPIILYGDQARLMEIFQNLVDNAVKFMGDQPAPRIEIGAEDIGGEMGLFVRDNGIGLDPKFKSRIFGLFEKFDPSTDGVGLGLALVKRIVELHGGRIWVESEGLGKGTTIRFTLAKTRREAGRKEKL